MGSFGAAIGGGDALKAAMQKRGMDVGALQQMSASAPGGQPPIPTSIDQSAPNVMPSPQQAINPPQEPRAQPRSAEMEIALKALKGVVDTENKIAQAALGLR